MKGIDVGFGVFVDDAVRDDDRASFVGSTDAEKSETTGQASDRAEQALEGLG